MNLDVRFLMVLSACLAALLVSCHNEESASGYEQGKNTSTLVNQKSSTISGDWDAKSATAYLDQREAWWMSWEGAKRDHGTFCVSCHTVVPYLLSRPALRQPLAEDGPSIYERRIIANVRKRVESWKDMAPYYTDQNDGPHKTDESRATESVLNALILASYDAREGKLSEETRTALGTMWAFQMSTGGAKGAWLWEVFDLKPWESRGSQYYGAALAAIAVGTAPEDYRSSPAIDTNLKMLVAYLRDNANSQSPLNRAFLLWASTKMPNLITPKQQQAIVDEILAKQHSDGGWSLSSVALTWRDLNLESLFGKWKRDDGTPQEEQSDGLATGFLIFVLEEADASRHQHQVKKGRAWLVGHQNRADGSWTAYSLNKRRVPSSNAGHFMTDAATAFAVLALCDTGPFETRAY
jgi:squalene-hopene/tetraprenyl-beta-curcumene cyclase